MGRAPCCDKTKVKRGQWSPEEDITLKNYVERFGTGGNWIALPHKAGLKRCGKSCRLRWLNYLRPDIKHGGFTEEEDNIIFTLYNRIGSRWSIIASQLPGRTDNDVKNYWNTKLKKKLLAGNTSPKTSKDNSNNICNIATNNAMHFSSSTVPSSAFVTELDTYYYGNSDFSNMIPSRLQPVMNVNYSQNLIPQELVSLPRLVEVPEIGPSGDGAFTPLSSSQEVPSLSPFENKYGLWSANGGDEDDELLMGLVGSGLPYDLLNSFDFQEKNNEVYPNLA